MYFVEKYNGLSKWRVKVKFVYEKFLDTGSNPDNLAYIEEEFLIDTYSATEQYVTFSLEPIIDLSIQLPRRRFMTDSCFWRYQDADTCKFAGLAGITAGSSPGGVEIPSASVTGWIGSTVDIVFTEPGVNDVTIYTASVINAVQLTTDTVRLYLNIAFGAYDRFTVKVTPHGCKKTLADCKMRRNQLNYGSFPGVSGTRRLFI